MLQFLKMDKEMIDVV